MIPTDILMKYKEEIESIVDKGTVTYTKSIMDPITEYIVNTVDKTGVLNEGSLRRDGVKKRLSRFVNTVLESIKEEQEIYCKEKNFIQDFRNEDIDGKRQMWNSVNNYIKQHYSRVEINMEGYKQSFKTHDRDIVLSSIISEWEQALENKFNMTKKDALNSILSNKKDNALASDIKADKLMIDNTIAHCYDKVDNLEEILSVMGREQQSTVNEEKEAAIRYLPLINRNLHSLSSVDSLSLGNIINQVLPSEMVFLADKATENIFMKKFTEKQLIEFSSVDQQETFEKEAGKAIKMDKGPIIVSIDTSGSMSEEKERIAKGILFLLLELALKQKRQCFVISFSVSARYIELTNPKHWQSFEEFMRTSFVGGTDGEEMLGFAIEALQSKKYSMADVLIISDFDFSLPLPLTQRQIKVEKSKGTRFYGLKISKQGAPSYSDTYEEILDKMWQSNNKV